MAHNEREAGPPEASERLESHQKRETVMINGHFPAPPYSGEAHEHVPSLGDAEICERCENYHTNPTHIRHPDGVLWRAKSEPAPGDFPNVESFETAVDNWERQSGTR